MTNTFSSYLKFDSPKQNKQSIIGNFLVFLYLIGILPLLAIPFSLPFFLVAIVPAVFITFWGIIYIIAPYKYEKSYYLFLGVYGVVNTYVYFVSIQKLLYINLEIDSLSPFLFNVILFILLIGGMNWMNWKAIYNETYYKLQQKSSIPVGWASIAGVSYILGQIILSVVYTDSGISILIIVCLSILSLFTAFLSINIHRYFFIKKNMEIVKRMFPEFGLPMLERRGTGKKKKNMNKNIKK
ncbi:hypothetical protein MPH47_01485 [Psychrobacillus psychrodurans]|uniref:hypothetical protein n=1 Tax=Psychrobacillus psychrodurans TaxID=126157 RepID=UPI001F4E9BCC|nr:hypothetical protein [Psychrobacillus psychrodurans]MCK1995907.1 hypothetical protein [Psychrobacillus psychrodurans]